MTAIHASAARSRATRFERALLDAAAALEQLAIARAERRVTRDDGRLERQDSAADARADARAHGGIGVLPR